MDTAKEIAIHVHLSEGEVMNFTNIANGLYCHDTGINITHKLKSPVSVYSFINKIEHNLTLYTRREKITANKARRLYRKSLPPSPQRFITILDSQYYCSYLVTPVDVKRAIHIWGKYIAYIQVKTKR